MPPYLFRLVSNDVMLAPILPLSIDGSHPALRSLRFDVAQGIVTFCFMESPFCTGLSTFSRRCKALMSPPLSRSTRPGSDGASKRDRQRASPLVTIEARGRAEVSLHFHTVRQQRYHGARCPAGLCRLSPGPYSSPGLPFFNSSRTSLWIRPSRPRSLSVPRPRPGGPAASSAGPP
jgi:hypothetical protein